MTAVVNAVGASKQFFKNKIEISANAICYNL